MRGSTCDQVGCTRPSKWFLGREFLRQGLDHSRGHTACDEHLAEGARITLAQLHAEGETDARLDLRPIQSIEFLTV